MLFRSVGLADLVADSTEDYVDLAVALAGAPDRLATIRRDLRPLVANTMLDYDTHAAELQAALATVEQALGRESEAA